MSLDPGDVTRLTLLAALLVASIDVGIAFLMRAPREAAGGD